MSLEAAAEFLTEMSRYFERLPTNGEDATYWANRQNAENCRKIAALLAAPPSTRG